MASERQLQALALVPLTVGAPAAFAHGGLSSLRGLLPIYITLLVLTVCIAIWLASSLLLFFLSPARITRRKLTIYKVYAWLLVGILVVLCSASASFIRGIVILAALVIAAVIVGVTVMSLERARRRAPHLDA